MKLEVNFIWLRKMAFSDIIYQVLVYVILRAAKAADGSSVKEKHFHTPLLREPLRRQTGAINEKRRYVRRTGK